MLGRGGHPYALVADAARQVLSNLVNFRSFGFTKIVPRVPEEKFAAVVEKSANAANAVPLWNEVRMLDTCPSQQSSRLKRRLYSSRDTSTNSYRSRATSSGSVRWATSPTTTSASLQPTKRLRRSRRRPRSSTSPSSTPGRHQTQVQASCHAEHPCRVRKDGPDNFTLLVASADSQAWASHEIEILDKKAKLTVEYGDFADSLQKAVSALAEVR